jgi:uncharacterized protein
MRFVDLLVIQPTPFCNINCSYCYLPDRTNSKKITATIVEHAIRSLIKSQLLGKEVTIVWHAGEPLTLPPNFYRPLFDLISELVRSLNVSVRHSIQTNGTLLTQEWCDFINEHQIRIGVSVDGPQPIHDANRKTRSGRGTFDNVIRGIKLLRQNDIPYHAIAVVTQATLADPEGFFAFFYNNGFFNLGLNIEEVEGAHRQSSIFGDTLYRDAINFYTTLFDLYIASDRHMAIREFDRSMNAILRNPETLDITSLLIESHLINPMSIISIDYQGNFSTFSPELIGQKSEEYNNFILGNVLDSDFAIAEKSTLLKKMSDDIIKGVNKCKRECDYFYICGGGAPSNKFFENMTFNSSETNYCKYNIKIPSGIVLTYLEQKILG